MHIIDSKPLSCSSGLTSSLDLLFRGSSLGACWPWTSCRRQILDYFLWTQRSNNAAALTYQIPMSIILTIFSLMASGFITYHFHHRLSVPINGLTTFSPTCIPWSGHWANVSGSISLRRSPRPFWQAFKVAAPFFPPKQGPRNFSRGPREASGHHQGGMLPSHPPDTL